MTTFDIAKLVRIRCALKKLQILVEDIINEECKLEHEKEDKKVANDETIQK